MKGGSSITRMQIFFSTGSFPSCSLDAGFYFSNVSTLVVISSICIPSSIPQCKKSYKDFSCPFIQIGFMSAWEMADVNEMPQAVLQ